ncbi:hypothetical protein HMPREF9018_1527 [Prevotella amnii CRIS 21A-A]|uniref:Uncharacterized protein n=1 Tax=Prevotella amnii CRIS 21A-A TaxID=679191 RepID=E1GT36_9BACT|nr:hypothetical protein HMPREF9018_1527 [Prevotella amnii CRIS 21A-A]
MAYYEEKIAYLCNKTLRGYYKTTKARYIPVRKQKTEKKTRP